MSSNILNFLDKQGRIKTWPSKKEMKLEVLEYLAGKFEFGRFYREQEINNIINDWHTFNDYFLLRRGLIDGRFLSRTRNGAKYWREERT